MVAQMFARGVKRLKYWSYCLITRSVILALFGLIALIGVGFIAAGSYFSLTEFFTPWTAGLIVGCVMLLMALLGAWITVLYLQKTTQSLPPENPMPDNSRDQSKVDTAAHLGEIVGARLSNSNIRTIDVMIAALVAGTILGASPALRKRLSNRQRSARSSRPPQQHEPDKT
ncbi:MAG: hypothetical protein AMJ55_02885 [Gammaproteobacteria bacterium SG8_15]|nr:MAG: hypothetical protein AMJ55_02885 [Gammaproteobacteria bacterium SG8_15]